MHSLLSAYVNTAMIRWIYQLPSTWNKMTIFRKAKSLKVRHAVCSLQVYILPYSTNFCILLCKQTDWMLIMIITVSLSNTWRQGQAKDLHCTMTPLVQIWGVRPIRQFFEEGSGTSQFSAISSKRVIWGFNWENTVMLKEYQPLTQ